MTLHDAAEFVLYSPWSNGFLWVLMAVTIFTMWKYFRTSGEHSRYVDAMYIDPDDRDPDSTLKLMREEAMRLHHISRLWVNRFFTVLAITMFYTILVSASSHYLL
jgi:hypothetical protein